MVSGHFGYYCSHTELHPEHPCEAKCEKEIITINKEDYESMSERDETLIKENIELQKQLEEKKKEIDEFKRIGEKGHLNDLLEDKRKENRVLIKASEQLLQQLESQPAEIVEKINGEIYTRMVVECKETKYTDINLILDNILKEYQKKLRGGK